MKKILSILIFLLIIGCDKKPTETRIYPSDLDVHAEIIDLNNSDLNFREITRKITNNIEKDYGGIILEFIDDKAKKHIIPFTYGPGCYNSISKITITSDSIFKAGKHPMSSLKQILRKNYFNHGKDPLYAHSPEVAYTEISIDKSSKANELKRILTNLTRAFDEIKSESTDSIQLIVYFQNIPPPPPPPPPLEPNKK